MCGYQSPDSSGSPPPTRYTSPLITPAGGVRADDTRSCSGSRRRALERHGGDEDLHVAGRDDDGVDVAARRPARPSSEIAAHDRSPTESISGCTPCWKAAMLRSRDSLLDVRRNDSRPVLSAGAGGGAVVAGGSVGSDGAGRRRRRRRPGRRPNARPPAAAVPGSAAASTSTTIGPAPAASAAGAAGGAHPARRARCRAYR